MRVHILAYDGTEMIVSRDQPPAIWDANMRDPSTGRFKELTEADLDELTGAEQFIRGLVERIVQMTYHRRAAAKRLWELQAACQAYWICTPDIRSSFDTNAGTMDGFVKIYPDHIECGWQEPSEGPAHLHQRRRSKRLSAKRR